MKLTVDSGQLPQGWTVATLGDICEIARGGSPRPIKNFLTNDRNGVNWIKIGDASASSKYIYETKEKIKTEGIKSSRLVGEGDFLLSNSMSFGRPYIMKTTGCIHDGWLVLTDKSNLFDQDYLYYFLGSETTYKQFDDLAAGSTVRNLNTKLVRKVRVVLPPLPEQKQIVAILDEAFEGIDRAIANTEKNLANAREIFESYLNSVFSQKGDDWVEKKFSDVLLVQPRNGWSPPARNHSETGTPVLTLSSVTGFEFDIGKVKYTNAFTKQNAHYWLKNGEFLITRSNTRELVGHVAICNGVKEPIICCDLIMKMRINEDKVKTRFAYWYFRTYKLRELIMSSARGANPTMRKINKSIVQNLPLTFPYPPIQETIINKLDNVYKETKRLEAIYQSKLKALQELKQSILHKAFTGQLTMDKKRGKTEAENLKAS